MARNAHRFHPHARVLDAAFFGPTKRHDLTRVSRLMGVPYTTMRDYCINAASMPLDLVAPLYLATRDLQLVSDLLSLGDVGLTVSVDPAATDADSVRDLALGVGAAAGRVQQLVHDSLRDNKIDDLEQRKIDDAAEAAERQIETLRKAARGGRKR